LLAARGLFLALSLLIQINLDRQWLPKRRGPEIRPDAARAGGGGNPSAHSIPLWENGSNGR